ncbi:hypothetical conserved protein [Candidatus Nitrosoglobus terrae]|uniref:Hypothetical conserved protein n=1 Tax=Candidatus Nitrosoglobus terrae TaxID=1630141 RepID=A0A1Q2SPU5_9GAMM|nr:EF-hand domain-containing protein [Candidatus Nitrosoglobus terrae]BAW81158.1 hypothetical conserved protein [Candidatus Nitrosoglobus terrae]
MKTISYLILLGGVLSLVSITASGANLSSSQNTYPALKMGINKDKEMRSDERFKKMDKNRDGRISKQELRSKGGNKFKRLDTNKDGYVSKEEFEANGKKHQRRQNKRHSKKEGSQFQGQY